MESKKVLLFGLLGFGIFTLLCGFAVDFWTMFAFRLLAGISAAFVSPQVWAAIPQLVQPHKVLKAMGVVTAGLAFSQMLGVPIGAYSYHRVANTLYYDWLLHLPDRYLDCCSLARLASFYTEAKGSLD